jgi:hypothetical protein
MKAQLRSAGFDFAMLLLLFGVGTHVRMGRLGAALVNGDSVGPYWKAATILAGGGWSPRSHAVESGPALYWLHVLFVAGAGSLEEAFTRRFVAQALVAPLVYIAVRALTRDVDRGWSRAAALLAGGVFVFSAGLRQTLESGYQGYLAIEVAAAIVAALAVARRWGPMAGPALVLIPVAMMCHPFAVAYLPAGLAVALAIAWTGDRLARASVLVGLVAAAGLGLKRLRRLAEPALDSGTFDFAAIAAIPAGNDTGASLVEVVVGSLRAIPDHGGFVPLTLLGLLPPALAAAWSVERLREARGTVTMAAAVVVTLGVVGGAIGYLQPYHWRIAAPAVTVAAACVGARALAGIARPEAIVGVLLVGILAGTGLSWGPPVQGPSDLQRHAALAGIVSRGGGWVEFGTVGDRMWGSPVAVRLEQRLRRGPPEVIERAAVHLVLAGPPEALAAIERTTLDAPEIEAVATLPGGPESALLVVRLGDARASESWTERACATAAPLPLRVERRALDYLGFERPELKEAFISMWWDECTGGNIGW